MNAQLQPGDIGLIGGGNSGEQKATPIIQKKTTSYMEMLTGEKTLFTHANINASTASLESAQGVEMTWPEMRRFWWRDYLDAGAHVKIYRIKGLTERQRAAIVHHMSAGLVSRKTLFNGGRPEKYGTWKLFTYAISARLQWHIDKHYVKSYKKHGPTNGTKWHAIKNICMVLRGWAEAIKKLDWTKNYFCSQWVARAIRDTINVSISRENLEMACRPYLEYEPAPPLSIGRMTDWLTYSPDDLHDHFTMLVEAGIMEVVCEKNRPQES